MLSRNEEHDGPAPKFFTADYEYHQELQMPESRWKKALRQVVYWIAMKWMGSHIASVKIDKKELPPHCQ